MWIPNLSEFDGPAYKAIASAIGQAVQTKQLSAGDRLPTHRAMADALGVTVGTVTRGYAEAERQQWIEARVGSGTYIKATTDKAGMFYTPTQTQNLQTIDLCYSIALTQHQPQHIQKILASINETPSLLHRLMQYHREQGMDHHCEAGAKWLEITGFEAADKQRVLLCNGGQQGFFTALLALCQRGDTVLSDGLTYPGFISAARELGLRHIGLKMDHEGVTPEALELACQRYHPRLIYLMPRINNPTCAQMSLSRIQDIITLCRRFKLLIIEDDVQGCLTSSNQPLLTSHAPDISLLISSCSKALAGGLRVGFIYPPSQLFEKVANALRAQCWMTTPFTAEIAARWILSGGAIDIMQAQRSELQVRHQIVRKYLAPYTFNAVERAFNVWLSLPEQWRANEFVAQAAAQDVLIKSAEVFAAGQFPAPQAIRLCVGGDITRQQLEKGLQIISGILASEPTATPGLD